ncbi:MAG: hypothetical protein ACC660_05995 [Acidimicrobiales bacterium]
MPEHDEIREAFLIRGGERQQSVDEIALSLRPRMRRARFIRRAVATGITFSMAVVVGLAIASLDTATPPETVQADGSPQAVDDPEPPEPSASVAAPTARDTTPEPERSVQPTSVIGSDNSGEAPEPTPAQAPTTEPAQLEPSAEPPTVDPAPTAQPSPTAQPTPSDTPDPTPTNVAVETVDPPGYVIEISVGTITVGYTASTIVSVTPAPRAGYTSEVTKMEPTEAKVVFTPDDPDHDAVVEVEIHIEDGVVSHDISGE